jgi:hypothetical protein
MKPRNVLGLVLMGAVFAIFGMYVRTHEITAVVGYVFGGAALVAGLVADFDHVTASAVALLKAWRGGQ